LPIEVLTRDEVEKTVEERLKKLLADMQISKKIADLEASNAKLIDAINKLLSAGEGRTPEGSPLASALTRDLGLLVDQLQIQTTADSVTLKPKTRLRDQDFRTVRETVGEHGGFWSSQKRMFIVPRNRTP
jgi:uncharacterized membrane protein YccC